MDAIVACPIVAELLSPQRNAKKITFSRKTRKNPSISLFIGRKKEFTHSGIPVPGISSASLILRSGGHKTCRTAPQLIVVSWRPPAQDTDGPSSGSTIQTVILTCCNPETIDDTRLRFGKYSITIAGNVCYTGAGDRHTMLWTATAGTRSKMASRVGG